MRCPDLKELPEPARGKEGWPWTEQSDRLPETMQDGSQWPRITIVTPSYQQGQFIEETVRSVLLQSYPNLEYLVIDGGSTDQSMATIEKYGSWLDYWVSERDRGQSHAINKGMQLATGEILGWLNSDDWLERNALASVAQVFRELPENRVGITGACRWHREQTTEVRRPRWIFHPRLGKHIQYGLQQPSTFFRRQAFETIGGLDQKLHYVMDKDLWFRFQRKGWEFLATDLILSNFRCHNESKTTGKHRPRHLIAARENFRMRNKLMGSPLRRESWRSLAGSMAELALAYAKDADLSLSESTNQRRYLVFLNDWLMATILDPRILWRRIIHAPSPPEQTAGEED